MACLSYWHPLTGKLDRKYIRVCAVYRLLRRSVIGRSRALVLLGQRHTPKEMRTLRATVDLWQAGPIPHMRP